MNRRPAIAGVLVLAPALAQAQPGPTPSPSPSTTPAPTAVVAPTPSAIGPPLRANDPCTTISAIVTRPTVTNSVCTVRPNHVLIETGYQNTTAPGVGQTVVYPQAVIRIGTHVPALELDVTPPQYERATAAGLVTGNTDVGAGLKYVIGYTSRFSYGVQASWTAPTGAAAFSAGGLTSIYSLEWGYTLGSVFSLIGGVQDQILATSGQRYSSVVPSLAVYMSLPYTTGLFAEVAGFTHALGPGTSTRTQYIGGAYHDVGQRLQVDAEFGYSPTPATGKYHYVGAGLSYYF